MAEVAILIPAFIAYCSLVSMSMYKYVQLSDLANDFLNPIDVCKRLNRLTTPEIVLQCILCTTLFLGLDQSTYFLVLVNVPTVLFSAWRYHTGVHKLDPSDIMCYGKLVKERKIRTVMAVVYIITAISLLIILVVPLVRSLVGGDDEPAA